MAINGTEKKSSLSREGANNIPTPTAAEQPLSTLHDVTSADNNPPLPYRGPAPLKFQNPLVDSKLNNDALGTEKYVDNLPK